jgi:hypothetical protein
VLVLALLLLWPSMGLLVLRLLLLLLLLIECSFDRWENRREDWRGGPWDDRWDS